MNNLKFKRIGAFLIDAFIINGMFYLIINLYALSTGSVPNPSSYGTIFLVLFLQTIMALIYTLLCYKLYGGTLGKKILNLEITSTRHTGKLSIVELISREWSKWIIIYFFSIFAIMINIILLFTKSTSMHDMLSKTTVKFRK